MGWGSKSSVQYVSTRGEAVPLGFCDAVLTGLAPDGGLFVPAQMPAFAPRELESLVGAPFETVATTILEKFAAGDLSGAAIAEDVETAMATFSHPARTPLVQIGPNEFLLELFHGPTLAFKDVAMQVLARLMDRILTERGRRTTIVTATSGDTGAAAADAFKGREAIDLFILFPRGRVSDVQRRQMTTVTQDNVHTLAVEGDFDDCQRIVKSLFVDREFNRRVAMSGVNSINIARVAAQISYYIFAALALGGPQRAVSFSVPTGNFGDILAGDIARRMGLAIDRLVIATNANDIMHRTLVTGRCEPAAVAPSHSPSMDIQVSSNFERLLFELSGRDAASVRERIGAGRTAFALTAAEHEAMARHYASGRADDDDTAATIARVFRATGHVVDPHTAVGLKAASEAPRTKGVPLVTLATAHPAKFPEAVTAACGVVPEPPERLSRALGERERVHSVPAETEAVASLIVEHSRAVAA